MRLRLNERPCENCGQPYAPRLRAQRFCSTACRNHWHGRARPLLRLTAEERAAIVVVAGILKRLGGNI